ncbi:MAG: hypothetical protein K0V04_37210 [Deltaproteobacteria bacterium]|nr:hypothetical protein [Deltaproteobacteria bacterium]
MTSRRIGRARLTCTACGHGKDWAPSRPGVIVGTTNQHAFAPGEVTVGSAVDWYFHLPLWLPTACCGETLWAYNADHLAFLRAYVGAELRGSTRSVEVDGWTNRALASRLPRWMKLAKNRATVLRKITELEARLPRASRGSTRSATSLGRGYATCETGLPCSSQAMRCRPGHAVRPTSPWART